MKFRYLTLMAGITMMAAACGGAATNQLADTGAADTTQKVASQLPDNDNVANVLKAYFTLKDDLVASDSVSAKDAAAKLETELAQVKGCNGAAGVAGQIATTSDLAGQREEFLTLSQEVITLAKGFDVETPVYVAYCPMTNKGKGGYWITDTKEIKNPYYGKAMLTCGKITEEIK